MQINKLINKDVVTPINKPDDVRRTKIPNVLDILAVI